LHAGKKRYGKGDVEGSKTDPTSQGTGRTDTPKNQRCRQNFVTGVPQGKRVRGNQEKQNFREGLMKKINVSARNPAPNSSGARLKRRRAEAKVES